MIDTKKFVDGLIEKGYSEFIGVPCSNLKSIINYTTNLGIYISATNEGDAVAYAVGASLSGKKVAVLMQNSGITNAMSPLTSLIYTIKIPILMIVGNRGVGPDEPQHELMGKITGDLLAQVGIVSTNLLDNNFSYYMDCAESSRSSLAILVGKGDLDNVKLSKDPIRSRSDYELSRSDVLQTINEVRDEGTIVVSTTGFCSRELYDKYDCDNNFYMVGSMGCAISLAAGIASSNPDKWVICIDGDGAVLMRPSGLYLANEINCPNLIHVIIANGSYESTGGQSTPTNFTDLATDVAEIYNTTNSDLFHKVTKSTEELRDALVSLFNRTKYYDQYTVKSIVVHTRSESDNHDLGRPKETMVELGNRFSKYLKKNSSDE